MYYDICSLQKNKFLLYSSGGKYKLNSLLFFSQRGMHIANLTANLQSVTGFKLKYQIYLSVGGEGGGNTAYNYQTLETV